VTVGAALVAVLAVGALTYAARAAPILLLADRTMPREVQRALRYVGPAVLSALVISLVAGGEGIGGVEIEEIAAIAVGCLVAYLTKSLIASLAAGMVVLWLLIWMF
jgi:branched-subunit amino acid transport protein